MKVLFAVNNENISEAIIKKYQKEYKEILTYKNVYYFNAILKELQKDKTYDRIVISEDLEPFANNNYDIIDKFLFDKLDNISDEATDMNGNDIPIILICTDRRSKSDSLLIKLFGIGIYSAIIGKDRSIDEVCRLISMPRTKKEAKVYYKIEAEDVNYQTESENDVSEVEIQNILMHYKRLGKNSDRYVDSFNNIASQYTDNQLRVIAKFLPLNVKAILEAESPKYQELMMENTKGKGGKVNILKTQKNALKPSEIEFDAFNSKEEKIVSSKPIVIPSTIKAENPVKAQKDNKREQVETSNIESTEIEDVDPVIGKIDSLGTKSVTKRRGRPRKQKIEDEVQIDEFEDLSAESEEVNEEVQSVKKGRGRPRKNENSFAIANVETEEKKKRRGRPKKEIENELREIDARYEEDDENEDIEEFEVAERETPKRTEEQTVSLFDLDEEDSEETFKNINNDRTELEEIKEKNQNIANYDSSDVLVTGEGKIVSFIGTSKNGTTFVVNNLALMLSESGIKTAILDATENRNSYYIYTKNLEDLRNKAAESLNRLEQGNTGGIAINKNLDLYTGIPGDKNEYNILKVLDTLSREYSVVLVDCDFTSKKEIFENSKEIYLVQSMDILTIQPLTSFLRDLKNKNALDSSKIRIIINKYEKIKHITPKALIGGMANYNDPGMSFMTELFNKDEVKFATIPLDVEVYLRYLEGIANCEISTRGYSKNFISAMENVKNAVYPLINMENKNKNEKYRGFSNDMDQTLSKMRRGF